jgi:hypothetical protein
MSEYKCNHIKNFLINLNKKLGDNCFVSGTYIFEGDNLFRYLCDSNIAVARLGQGNILNCNPVSHNLHIFNKLFKAHKLNDNENVVLVKTENYNNFQSYKQYEIDLDECALQYPCNSDICNKQKGAGNTGVNNHENTINIDDNTINLEEDETSHMTFDNSQGNMIDNLNAITTEITNAITNKITHENIIKFEDEIYCKLNEENKKSCLFYRFHVSIAGVVYTYTFLKLETSPTINIRDAFDHAVHAAKHYFTINGTKRKNTWSIRREDYAVYSILNKDNMEHYVDSFKPSKIKKCIESKIECKKDSDGITLRFKPKESLNKEGLFFGFRNLKEYVVGNLNISIKDIRLPYRTNYKSNETYTTLPLYRHYEEDHKLFGKCDSFEIYNNNVRTRNEMFIPLKFYEDLLLPTNVIKNPLFGQDGGYKLFMKTNKLYLYNGRNYTVYKNKASKQEYIKLHKTYTLCTSLKKQTYRKLQQKHTYNGQKHIVYETIKDNRKFIMINNRRKYLI